ncbi:MAG: GIVxVP protein [Cyanobacteriota bacterium]|nr:GIVxVP protein [Cyanobacteriota bacterium]
MSLNRTARGIVLVPSLLLGGAFLAAATWGEGAAAENRTLALALGGLLIGAGLIAQLWPEGGAEPSSDHSKDQP